MLVGSGQKKGKAQQKRKPVCHHQETKNVSLKLMQKKKQKNEQRRENVRDKKI